MTLQIWIIIAPLWAVTSPCATSVDEQTKPWLMDTHVVAVMSIHARLCLSHRLSKLFRFISPFPQCCVCVQLLNPENVIFHALFSAQRLYEAVFVNHAVKFGPGWRTCGSYPPGQWHLSLQVQWQQNAPWCPPCCSVMTLYCCCGLFCCCTLSTKSLCSMINNLLGLCPKNNLWVARLTNILSQHGT